MKTGAILVQMRLAVSLLAASATLGALLVTPAAADPGECVQAPNQWNPNITIDGDALHRSLLRDIKSEPSLLLIVASSFQVEEAVYLKIAFPVARTTSTSLFPFLTEFSVPDSPETLVVATRAKKQIANERSEKMWVSERAEYKSTAASREWKGLSEKDVDVSTAPISERAARAMIATWEAALRDRCNERLLMCDGVAYQLSAWARTGWLHSPSPGTRGDALVELGAELSAYARAPARERAAREVKLIDHAKALTARFAN